MVRRMARAAVTRAAARQQPAPPPWWDGSPPRSRPSRRAGPPVRAFGGPAPRHRQVPALAAAAALAVAVGLFVLAGARTVATPFLSYTAPAGWAADATDAAALPGTPALLGTSHGPDYDCGGESHVRGFAAAALLPTDGAAGPADRAERLARWFAATSYPTPDGAAPEVTLAAPRPVQVAGPQGPVDGTVTELTAAAPGRGGCPAVRGTVLVLAAPVSGGAALLLVAGDTDGGPAEPRPADRAVLDDVLGSVRLA